MRKRMFSRAALMCEVSAALLCACGRSDKTQPADPGAPGAARVVNL